VLIVRFYQCSKEPRVGPTPLATSYKIESQLRASIREADGGNNDNQPSQSCRTSLPVPNGENQKGSPENQAHEVHGKMSAHVKVFCVSYS
jgi:hypothetical protein